MLQRSLVFDRIDHFLRVPEALHRESAKRKRYSKDGKGYNDVKRDIIEDVSRTYPFRQEKPGQHSVDPNFGSLSNG
jgi:hypothetical protein